VDILETENMTFTGGVECTVLLLPPHTKNPRHTTEIICS